MYQLVYSFMQSFIHSIIEDKLTVIFLLKLEGRIKDFIVI